MKIKVSVKGTAPLLLHKYAEVDNSTSKKKKKVYVPQEEAERVCYRTEDGKIYIPSTHFKGCMIKSGVDFVYSGRKTYKDYIKSGIFFKEKEIILTPQKYTISNMPVVISRSRIMRSRPEFKEWECSFTIEIINEDINKSILKEILQSAGKFQGVGDFRPEYGRFEVVSFEEVK
jgi:hypothetical protein